MSATPATAQSGARVHSSYTKVPNALCDRWLDKLGKAAFKVIFYAFRRTEGFQKKSDPISLSQFSRGITRNDGEKLDGGTGLCRQSVVTAIHTLEQQKLLIVERGKTVYGDHEVNRYTIDLAVLEQGSEPVPEQPACADVQDRVIAEICADVEASTGPDITSADARGTQPVHHGRVPDTAPTSDGEQPPLEGSAPTTAHAEPVDDTAAPVPEATAAQPPDPILEKLLEQMLALGVARSVAEDLLRTCPPIEILTQLSALPHRSAHNPAALFVTAVRQAWPPPPVWATAKRRAETAREEEETRATQMEQAEVQKARSLQAAALIALLGPRAQLRLHEEALQRLYEDAPIWKSRDVSSAMLDAYKRTIATQWLEDGYEPDPDDYDDTGP